MSNNYNYEKMDYEELKALAIKEIEASETIKLDKKATKTVIRLTFDPKDNI